MSFYEMRVVLNEFMALDEMACRLVTDSRVGDHDHWFLRFREGLHGMLARVTVVAQNLRLVHEWEKRHRTMLESRQEIECHTSVILFGMDSSLECYVFTMNALGYAVSRKAFEDLTDAVALRRIGPKNILGGGAKDRNNPLPGYQQLYPSAVAHWVTHASLIQLIMEHHDVNKHRKASTGGWKPRSDPPHGFFEDIEASLGRALSVDERAGYEPPSVIYLTEEPKLPGSMTSSTTYDLESIVEAYKKFIDELMILTVKDVQDNVLQQCIP